MKLDLGGLILATFLPMTADVRQLELFAKHIQEAFAGIQTKATQ
jgi:hypothetical protein